MLTRAVCKVLAKRTALVTFTNKQGDQYQICTPQGKVLCYVRSRQWRLESSFALDFNCLSPCVLFKLANSYVFPSLTPCEGKRMLEE